MKKAKSAKSAQKGMTAYQTAAALGKIGRKISATMVREYWADGAPRDSAQKFLLWLEEHHPGRKTPPEVKDKKAEKLQKEIDVLKQTEIRARMRNEREAGQMVSFAEVEFVFSRALSAFFAAMDKAFDEKFPTLLKGMGEMEIRKHCRAEKAVILEGLRGEFEKFIEQTKEKGEKKS